ncbi:MAG TPA: hypothetical protein VE343_10045, partial [Streptosporangiaceae bacterium]|nr:hypothetical protein [Streptosporangiaceae bacterium]
MSTCANGHLIPAGSDRCGECGGRAQQPGDDPGDLVLDYSSGSFTAFIASQEASEQGAATALAAAVPEAPAPRAGGVTVPPARPAAVPGRA